MRPAASHNMTHDTYAWASSRRSKMPCCLLMITDRSKVSHSRLVHTPSTLSPGSTTRHCGAFDDHCPLQRGGVGHVDEQAACRQPPSSVKATQSASLVPVGACSAGGIPPRNRSTRWRVVSQPMPKSPRQVPSSSWRPANSRRCWAGGILASVSSSVSLFGFRRKQRASRPRGRGSGAQYPPWLRLAP